MNFEQVLVYLCSGKEVSGPWLLFISESGHGKRVPLASFRTSPLNRVGLIGYKVLPSFSHHSNQIVEGSGT